jgi:hypothetical protein
VVPVASAVWLLFGATASATADFCESQTIRDYTRVLERLPAIPSPPLDEQLNFAPAQVFLGHRASDPLQVGREERGFALTFGPSEEGGSTSRRLDWQVTSRLAKLDRRGRRIGPPRKIERHVQRLRAVDFGFEVPGKPAIYRLEIVFENERGERLARFGEYFRVLRPSLDVDFFLNGATFHRGEQVRAWLVNRGVAILSFGLFKAIEYDDGTTWSNPPVAFPNGPVPAIGLAIGPGVKTSCWKTTIPTDAALGVYRFATEVEHSTKAPFSGSGPLDFGAEFTVVE